jgi:E3 ubiquitin-protein ligase TRIP12
VAGLLASGDPAVVAAALQLAQLLMAKLPDVFRTHFVKEGVVHEMDKLAASAPSQASHDNICRLTGAHCAPSH